MVDIQLRVLARRLSERRLTLEVTPQAKAWLARRGYDPVFGARPLKRLIQREISDPLALALLEGRYSDGDTVTVDAPLESVAVMSSAGLSEAGVAGAGSGGLDEDPDSAALTGGSGDGLVLR